MRSRYFQFRLRTLLLATTVVAAFAGVLGSQIAGRLQTEEDPLYFTHHRTSMHDIKLGRGPYLSFACSSEEHARSLQNQIDWKELHSELQQIAKGFPAPTRRSLASATFYSNTIDHYLLIGYDFAHWGRYRLDPRRMTYVFDEHDSIAEQRNAEACRAFDQLGDSFVQKHPSIRRIKK